MVYQLAIASGEEISAEMASCLYAAVLTDTGSFTFACTTPSPSPSPSICSSVAPTPPASPRPSTSPTPRAKSACSGRPLQPEVDGEVAWTWITHDDMERASAIVEDCEGIVNYLISIARRACRRFPSRAPRRESEFRLNLRSKGTVDVAEVAERFGGGGHRNASGCTIDGPITEAVPVLVSELHLACRSACATLLA